MIISKIYYSLINNLRNKKNRRRLKKQPRSIICNNCWGGFVLHWLKQPFNSPTVNLFIKPHDFNTMLLNFDYYFDSETPIIECKDSGKDYPVGQFFDGVKLFFMHYKTFEEALSKWKERCKRIDKEHLYVVLTERDGCTVEDLKAFDDLPFSNKVAFTHIEYPFLKCGFYIRGFEHDDCVGHMHTVCNRFSGKRYSDQFDYVSFLNN